MLGTETKFRFEEVFHGAIRIVWYYFRMHYDILTFHREIRYKQIFSHKICRKNHCYAVKDSIVSQDAIWLTKNTNVKLIPSFLRRCNQLSKIQILSPSKKFATTGHLALYGDIFAAKVPKSSYFDNLFITFLEIGFTSPTKISNVWVCRSTFIKG